MVKRIIELHHKYGNLGVFYIVVVRGFIKLFTRRTKISSGWQTPIASSITEEIHGSEYREISANENNLFQYRIKKKFVKGLGEDIYPLV